MGTARRQGHAKQLEKPSSSGREIGGAVKQYSQFDNDKRSERTIAGMTQAARVGRLTFAEKIITSPARLWLESSVDQRQRLQQTFFPNGLTFNGDEF